MTLKNGDVLALDRCPHCGVDRPNLPVQYRFETKNYNGNWHRVWFIYACSRCGGVVTACSEKSSGIVDSVYPAAPSVDESVPGRARDYLLQAISSLSAPAGSVMLAASAVDAMLKHKGLSEGSLYSRIEKAADDNLITKDMATWAHEVRLDANDQRHADNGATLPSVDEAKMAIDFVLALADFMFVLPSKVSRGIEHAEISNK